jgi:hypothetical protein
MNFRCGAIEVVPFPVVALPNFKRDGTVESHVSQRTRNMGTLGPFVRHDDLVTGDGELRCRAQCGEGSFDLLVDL